MLPINNEILSLLSTNTDFSIENSGLSLSSGGENIFNALFAGYSEAFQQENIAAISGELLPSSILPSVEQNSDIAVPVNAALTVDAELQPSEQILNNLFVGEPALTENTLNTEVDIIEPIQNYPVSLNYVTIDEINLNFSINIFPNQNTVDTIRNDIQLPPTRGINTDNNVFPQQTNTQAGVNQTLPSNNLQIPLPNNQTSINNVTLNPVEENVLVRPVEIRSQAASQTVNTADLLNNRAFVDAESNRGVNNARNDLNVSANTNATNVSQAASLTGINQESVELNPTPRTVSNVVTPIANNATTARPETLINVTDDSVELPANLSNQTITNASSRVIENQSEETNISRIPQNIAEQNVRAQNNVLPNIQSELLSRANNAQSVEEQIQVTQNASAVVRPELANIIRTAQTNGDTRIQAQSNNDAFTQPGLETTGRVSQVSTSSELLDVNLNNASRTVENTSSSNPNNINSNLALNTATPLQARPILSNAVAVDLGQATEIANGNDIARQIALAQQNNAQNIRLSISPENLGAIDISIDDSRDGINVNFVAQNAAARDALEAFLPRLREMLEQGGLNLQNANVSQQGEQQSNADYSEASAQEIEDNGTAAESTQQDNLQENDNPASASNRLIDAFA